MALLGTIIFGKLVYEQFFGAIPGSELSSGGAVITAAHVYGAIGGLTAIAIMNIRVRRKPPI
jgi:hypothetical protein